MVACEMNGMQRDAAGRSLIKQCAEQHKAAEQGGVRRIVQSGWGVMGNSAEFCLDQVDACIVPKPEQQSCYSALAFSVPPHMG